jgi:hypothetical protein
MVRNNFWAQRDTVVLGHGAVISGNMTRRKVCLAVHCCSPECPAILVTRLTSNDEATTKVRSQEEHVGSEDDCMALKKEKKRWLLQTRAKRAGYVKEARKKLAKELRICETQG